MDAFIATRKQNLPKIYDPASLDYAFEKLPDRHQQVLADCPIVARAACKGLNLNFHSWYLSGVYFEMKTTSRENARDVVQISRQSALLWSVHELERQTLGTDRQRGSL
jgi:hypothetical protein